MSDTALSPFEALADELGAVAARIERDLRAQFTALADAIKADHRAEVAAMRAQVAEAEVRAMKAEQARDAAVTERLALVRDGRDGVSLALSDVAPMIEAEVLRRIAAIPVPKDGEPGRDADPEMTKVAAEEAVAAAIPQLHDLIVRTVADEVARIPPAPTGKDADPEVVRAMVAEAVAAIPPAPAGEPGPEGPAGPPGRLPTVKAWDDAVHYEGAVVTHAGATWQAQRDTGRAPPHEDWTCLAAPGRDGADGRSFTVRGTWSEGEEYRAMDVIARDGSGYVARVDNPGPCPGDGWQLIASKGKRGGEGEGGRKGDPGPAGPGVVALEVDSQGMMLLRNGDGSVARCDLYPLLSRLG